MLAMIFTITTHGRFVDLFWNESGLELVDRCQDLARAGTDSMIDAAMSDTLMLRCCD